MTIETVESMFEMLEKIGFDKETTAFGASYIASAELGKGRIDLIGDMTQFYLIEGDFTLKKAMSMDMEVKIQDKFIELTYVETPFEFDLQSDSVTINNLSCHVNIDMPKYSVSFPAAKRMKYFSIIIRENFIKDSFPVFYKEYFYKTTSIDTNTLDNPKIIAIILELFSRNYDSYANQVYLHGKIHEIMSLLIAQIDVADKPSKMSTHNYQAIRDAKKVVEDHYSNPLSLVELAKKVGTNVKTLKDGFKQLYGHTVFGYIRFIRMQKSMDLLIETDLNVEDIANTIGYASTTHFYKNFRKEFGITPSQYRKQNR